MAWVELDVFACWKKINQQSSIVWFDYHRYYIVYMAMEINEQLFHLRHDHASSVETKAQLLSFGVHMVIGFVACFASGFYSSQLSLKSDQLIPIVDQLASKCIGEEWSQATSLTLALRLRGQAELKDNAIQIGAHTNGQGYVKITRRIIFQINSLMISYLVVSLELFNAH